MLIVLLVTTGAAVAGLYLEAVLHSIMDGSPKWIGFALTALFAIALIVSRTLRLTVRVYLTFIVLISPFIIGMLVGYSVLMRFLPRQQAETIFFLTVMAPGGILIFWVLIFANRREVHGKEGWLRHFARRWGSFMPEHQPGFFSYLVRSARKKPPQVPASVPEHTPNKDSTSSGDS